MRRSRSPRIFPILEAAATSRVHPMLDLRAFSCEVADEATVAVGEWITCALTYLFVKCILRTYGFRKLESLGGLTGGGITISVLQLDYALIFSITTNSSIKWPELTRR